MKPARSQNLRVPRHIVPGMRLINDAHVAEPGLAVVQVAACDDQTAFAVQELLAGRWATAQADRGEPGVRLRCFLDVRQEPDAYLGPDVGRQQEKARAGPYNGY